MFKFHNKFFISRKNHNQKLAASAFGLGFLGVLIGSIFGLFASPKSGKENREELKNLAKEKSGEFSSKFKKFTASAAEKGNKVKTQMEGALSKTGDKINSKAEEAKEITRDLLDDAKDKIK